MDRTRLNPSLLGLFLILLAALAGMALVAYATGHGPGVGGDATIYLTSAQNLVAGKGLGWMEADGSFRLLPYTPPFYPLALSGLGLFVQDLLSGARWLNIVLFGATIFLLGWHFWRVTTNPWLAALLAGAVAASPVLIGVQVWAMSESLTLFLGFAGLTLLLLYFDHPRRWFFWVSALLTGLSFLSRYIAVAFVATACLALLFVVPEGQRRRIGLAFQKAVWYGIVAILPMLVWLAIDFSITGTVGSRSGQPASAYWQRFLEIGPALQQIVLFWLLPDSVIARLPGLVQVAFWLLPLLALLGAGAWIFGRLRKQTATADTPTGEMRTPAGPLTRLVTLYALFVVVYLVVMALAQVFTYPPITLASRMLSPVHLAVVVLVFGLLSLALRVLPQGLRLPLGLRLVPVIVYLMGLGLMTMYGLRGFMVARDYHRTGIGYTSLSWQASGTIEALQDVPYSVPIISNETTAVMFLTGRPAYALQEIYQNDPLETFVAYGSGTDEAQRVFREKGGALVLFNSTLREDFAMYGERTEERLAALKEGLYLFYRGDDGEIYFSERPDFLELSCH